MSLKCLCKKNRIAAGGLEMNQPITLCNFFEGFIGLNEHFDLALSVSISRSYDQLTSQVQAYSQIGNAKYLNE
jgi:hypothetical protein